MPQVSLAIRSLITLLVTAYNQSIKLSIRQTITIVHSFVKGKKKNFEVRKGERFS